MDWIFNEIRDFIRRNRKLHGDLRLKEVGRERRVMNRMEGLTIGQRKQFLSP